MNKDLCRNCYKRTPRPRSKFCSRKCRDCKHKQQKNVTHLTIGDVPIPVFDYLRDLKRQKGWTWAQLLAKFTKAHRDSVKKNKRGG
jgi:predicted amidophosphoribosyltransferase